MEPLILCEPRLRRNPVRQSFAESPGVGAVSLVGTRRPGRNRENLAVAGSLSRSVREARLEVRCTPSLIASYGRRPRRREAQLGLPKCEADGWRRTETSRACG